MRIIEVIFPVGVVLILFIDQSNAKNNLCYHAKTCVHDGKERCGEDKSGNVRRFLDTCDIKEFNCLRNTNYVKVSFEKCEELPPIDGKAGDDHGTDQKEEDDGQEGKKENETDEKDQETSENPQNLKENDSLSVDDAATNDENADVDEEGEDKVAKKKY